MNDAQCDVLVLAIGNRLLGDDGVGIRAVRELAPITKVFPGVRLLDGGTLSFLLLPDIAQASQLIVLDAARLTLPAGSVRVFEGDDMDAFLRRGHGQSVHEVSLADLLGAARLIDALPAQRALIAVQPQTIDWGDCLSPAVESAISEVCRLADALIRRWRDHPHNGLASYPDSGAS